MQNLLIPNSIKHFLTYKYMLPSDLFEVSNNPNTTVIHKPKLVVFPDTSILGLAINKTLIFSDTKVINYNNKIALNILKNIKNRVPIGELIKECKCKVSTKHGVISIKFKLQEVTKDRDNKVRRNLIQYGT